MSIEWEEKSEEGKWLVGVFTRWQTKCKRYRLYKIVSTEGDKRGTYWGAVVLSIKEGKQLELLLESDRALGPGYPKYYNSQGDAVAAVERHYLRAHPNGISQKKPLTQSTPPTKDGSREDLDGKILTSLSEGSKTIEQLSGSLKGNIRLTLMKLLREKRISRDGNVYKLERK